MKTKDIYKNFTQGVVFSDEDIKMAIKHYKQLCNILMVSGREFHFSANEALRVYQQLYQFGIARELFTYETKEYKL